MKFPKRIKYHGRTLATIYSRCKGRESYRVAWQVAGQRRMASFPTYSLAKQHADQLVKDLAKGSQTTALKPDQARDALSALERLDDLYRNTGHRVSLLAAISEFADASKKLNGHTLVQAVEGYLKTVVSIHRKDLKEAVAEFLQADEPRTKATEGQRAQLSSKYAYNRQLQLERFSATLQNTSVCDLAKAHIDAFIHSLNRAQSSSRNGRAAVSAKSRNHYRATLRQFFQWCVRKDYLSPAHRLNEADAMRAERANESETQFYNAAEFQAIFEAAEGPMQAILAIGGLAGLRTSELLRLDWTDVWRVAGHIEITAGKAKTRQRRLVETCSALQAWLARFSEFKSGKLCLLHEITFQQHFVELCEKAKVPRKPNGLRHAFCTYHFALHANENLTSQQAGNSPSMIHRNYKGLATKTEAERWFAVIPKS